MTIEKAFHSASTDILFFEQIGDALAIRRAFRCWLSDRLAGDDGSASRLIEATVSNNAIMRHWKDETIVAALMSEYSSTFVQYFETKLLEVLPAEVKQGPHSRAFKNTKKHNSYDQGLICQVIFLLRIACKEVDQNALGLLDDPQRLQFRLSDFFTRPKGSGWDNFLAFLAKHKEEIGLQYINIVLPLLDDWTRHFKRGATTKAAGEIALYFLQEMTKDGEFPYASRSKTGEQLIRVILDSSEEIKAELAMIFQGVIERNESSNRSRYYELVKSAVSSVDKSSIVARNLPKEVIGLARILWSYTPPVRDGWGASYRNDIEQYFDLAQHQEYYPASAFQTPILQLLKVAPFETVNFILEFTNRSIEYFASTEFAKREVEKVYLQLPTSDQPIPQYISHRIWMIYRGGQHAPTVLESIHMALEKWLLTSAKNLSSDVIEAWCLYLLKNSRSASISAVVASIVLAEPSKLFNVAHVLFRTKDFFSFDLARLQFDMSAKSFYEIAHDPRGLFRNERLNTCDDKHRTRSLEHLALQYQILSSESEGEEIAKNRKETIWAILDEHYANVQIEEEATEGNKTWRLCLARMDRRKMTITSEIRDDQVFFKFNSEIDPELRKYSETALATVSESMRYTPLSLWARHRWEGNEQYAKYIEYDSDPKRVLVDTKIIYEGLLNGEIEDEGFRLMYRSVPPSACAVLLRDFSAVLEQQDNEFCREVLVDYASRPLRGNYNYQIGDGLDAAIIALPLLLNAFPDCSATVKQILLFTLFDSNPVGMNNRFSDYAVTSIMRTLWNSKPEDASSLFLGYLLLQPKFKELTELILQEKRAANDFNYSHFETIQRFLVENEFELSKVFKNDIGFDRLQPICHLDIDTLVTAFLISPIDNLDQQYKLFAIEVASAVATRCRHKKNSSEHEPLDYAIRHRFLQKFSHVVLNSDKHNIQVYVKPFIDNFATIDYAEHIFQEFVSAEDTLNKYDSFWIVWELFYPCVVELCATSWHSSSVVQNYLLAWPYWRKDAKEWHSLKERERSFFARVARDIGSHPAVLYSLAKVLNDIGSGLATEGILWISGILESHPDLSNQELETNTEYYLENLIRGYALRHRQTVRTTPAIKAATLAILNFLLEKGSVTAYLTREFIL